MRNNRPHPSDRLPDHLPPTKSDALEHQGIRREEVAALKAWARGKEGLQGRKFSEIKRARTRSRIMKTVLLAIAALGIGTGIANKDEISQWGQNQVNGVASWWNEGFNDEPRGPYPGITLKDPEAQRRLQCLSDKFSDEASLLPTSGNKWARENCKDITNKLENMGCSYDRYPLTSIANLKNQELRRAGLQSDNPYEHAVVEWRGQLLGMVYTDEDRLAEIAEAQKARTGTVNFTVK